MNWTTVVLASATGLTAEWTRNRSSYDLFGDARSPFVARWGADIGTTFPLKAITPAARPYRVPALTLTRGARRLRFFQGRRALVVLHGDLQHKNLWLIDLESGSERQLTNLAADFDIRDFDISPDGREVVVERVQEHSDIALIDLARRH